MTVKGSSSAAPAGRAPLVRRVLTRAGASGLDVVEWSARSVQITEPDGQVAFTAADVEAPTTWSDLAVAVVARRYFISWGRARALGSSAKAANTTSSTVVSPHDLGPARA